MYGETFKIGGIYSLKVLSIVRQKGIYFFTLQYKGKTTKPQWAKRGLSYHTCILPEQEKTDTEQFIGQTIQCRVAYFMDGFPVLEQVDESNPTHSNSLLPIFNHNATSQTNKKTALRGVSSSRRQTKEPLSTPKPAEQPCIPLPKEEQRVPVGAIYSIREGTKQEQEHKQATAKARKKDSGNQEKTSQITVLETRAKNGDTEAQFELGQHYEKNGKKQLAHQWYKKAAEQDHADAKFRLGVLYLQKAISYLQNAASQSHAQAALELEKLTKPGERTIPVDAPQHIWLHDTEENKQLSISRISRETHKTGIGYHAETSYQSQDFFTYEMVVKSGAQGQEDDKEADVNLLRVWMEQHSSVEGCEDTDIADGVTGNHGSGMDTSIWEMKEAEKWAITETEPSGHALVDSEQHDIDLKEPPSAPTTGCFFCRLLDKLSIFFSRK